MFYGTRGGRGREDGRLASILARKDGSERQLVFMMVFIISLACLLREQAALSCTWRGAATRIGYHLRDHTRFCGQMRVNCPSLPLGPRLPTQGRARGEAQCFPASRASERVRIADLGGRMRFAPQLESC